LDTEDELKERASHVMLALFFTIIIQKHIVSLIMSTLLSKDLKGIFEGWDPNTEIPEKFWYFWHARFQDGDPNLPGVLEIFASESISDLRYSLERRAIFIPMAQSVYVAILYYSERIKYVSLCRFFEGGKRKGRQRTSMLGMHGGKLVPQVWHKCRCLIFSDSECGQRHDTYELDDETYQKYVEWMRWLRTGRRVENALREQA
jgi:hypothetical protein